MRYCARLTTIAVWPFDALPDASVHFTVIV
jgi:hypothetical protein